MSINLSEVDAFKIPLAPVGQKSLRQAGPMIPASWYITAEHERELKVIGGTLPRPISGHMLLDTGAGHIGIDDDVARELGLKVLTTTSDVFGFGGSGKIGHYTARLIVPMIPMRDGKPLSGPAPIGIPVQDAWETQGIREKHREYGYTAPNGAPLEVIGVVGRIILQFSRMAYNGLTGAVELEIDHSILTPMRD